jgi:protease IV
MKLTSSILSLCTSLALVLGAHTLRAEPAVPRPSDGVVLPWRSIAFSDDASAIQVNPANIVRMPGPEGRVTVVYVPDASPQPLRGLEGAFALPFWMLGTGLRIDLMEPSSLSPAPFTAAGIPQRYAWVRWGNAVSLGDFASFGTTFAWSSSDSPSLHDFFSVASGLTLRPNRFTSAAVVVRDWNSPTADDGTEIEPSVDFGAAFRPIDGDRSLEIGLEASYRASDDAWVPTANAAVDLPYIGRFRAGGSLLDPRAGEVLVSAGLELNLDRLQITGGALFGNSLGVDGTGFVVGAAIRGWDEKPRVPRPARFVRFRIESTPGAREHVLMLRRLWKLADDDEVAGVLFEMRTSPAPSLAHAEELVDAIELLKQRGKKVLCHLEDAGGRELFVCSAAHRIAVNPAGGLRFAGLSSRYFYLGGLMNKLGIRADFVRIGKHKGAPEQFIEGPTEVAERDHRELLAEYERIYLARIARGRGMKVPAAKAAIAKGPFIAPEALDANLVDQLAYEDEIERFVEETHGDRIALVDYEPATEMPRTWRDKPKIAVVYLEGMMVDGKSQTIPLIGFSSRAATPFARRSRRPRTTPRSRPWSSASRPAVAPRSRATSSCARPPWSRRRSR